MKTRDKVSFAMYLFGSLELFVFGFVYMFCPTVMPYHKEAINTKWEDLSTGLQVLLHGLMKVAAAGDFVTGTTIIILLFIPFKRGESWARWALPLVALVWNIPCLYVASTVALKTHASTPWQVLVAGIIMVIVAFILSPPYNKAAL